MSIEELEKLRRDARSMVLRDRFAMAALQGVLSSTRINVECNPQQWAELAYEYADEILTARQK